MRALRVLRADTRPEVWTLAALAFAGAASTALALAFPISDHAPSRLQLTAMVAGACAAVALLRFRTRVRPWMLQAFIALRSVALGLMIANAATRSGATAIALLYIWSAIYAAVFFSRRATHAHVAFMIATYGVATLLGRASVGPTVWLVMGATVWVAAWVLSDLSGRLRAQAHSDALTGLLNRAGLAQAAEREREGARRRGTETAVAVLDLDDFKLVNDHGGHAAGDRLLIDLAAAWRTALRHGDLLARHGGDEFVLVLPDTSEAVARDVLERLADCHPGRWTAGLVTWQADEGLDAAIARADEILYAAKAQAHARAAEAAPL
jgi:GGDEF domain-containing protein